MKKKRKKVGKGFKIFALILTIMSLLLIGLIVYLGVLSNLLLGIIISIIILINIGCCFLLLKTKKKKRGIFITSILIILYGIISFYLYRTTDFLTSLTSNYKTYNYSVVVLKTSDYNKLKNIQNKQLGYYNEENDITNKALEKVTDKIPIDVSEYDNAHDLASDLFNKSIDAILIEDSYLDVIEINGDTIDENIRKIYSFSIKTKIDDMSRDLDVTKKAFNIYISGIDTYGEITSVSRSDVNMVVTINPTTQQVLLTSIPRDYYVQLHDKSGYPDKLTHAGMYGTETSIQTIEDLLGIEINYYIKVNFTSVINIVDTIGGVNVYSDYTFTSRDKIKYQEGYNQLNGEEALSFARERKAFATGDRQRVKNQQALLKAIFEKCLNPSIITKYTKLLNSLEDSFITNMKMNRMTSLVKMQLTKNYSWNIISNSLNGTDASNYTYSAPSVKAYVMQPVTESVNYASQLINNTINGQVLDKNEIEEEQKKINGVVAVQGNSTIVSNSTSSSNSTPTKKEDTKIENNNLNTPKEEGLKAKLIRPNIEINLGDEYIYNGITATYNGKNITDDTNLKVSFKVGNKIIDTYQELILYISKLKTGNYSIEHIVNYNNEKQISLYQNLTIKEVALKETIDNNEEEQVKNNKDETLNESLNENEDKKENKDEKENIIDSSNEVTKEPQE